MLIRCIRPFGRLKPEAEGRPADEVEVPDGSVFDTFYFKKAETAEPPASKPASASVSEPGNKEVPPDTGVSD